MRSAGDIKTPKNVAVIVAHPDDEILWTGGTLLNHPYWTIYIISLCRGSDEDRAPRFFKCLSQLGAHGKMGDADDGPRQVPLPRNEVEETILLLLPQKRYDLVITHHPKGEYTRHLRHEETSTAVIRLWFTGKLKADELYVFAYEDGNKRYFPRAVPFASIYTPLSSAIWQRKYAMITQTYGFEENSWEALTTPKTEAFWQFKDPEKAKRWMDQEKEES